MPKLKVTQIDLTAHFEDESELATLADQRDFAKWEVQDENAGEKTTFTRMRFLCWSALTRNGTYRKPWPVFQKECVEVFTTPDPEPEAGAGLDPTQPDLSGAP